MISFNVLRQSSVLLANDAVFKAKTIEEPLNRYDFGVPLFPSNWKQARLKLKRKNVADLARERNRKRYEQRERA